MPSGKRIFGDVGEAIAAKFLQAKGYRIVERNYRRTWGELDLIAEHGRVLVCCEVKTRKRQRGADGIPPEHNVNQRKAIKLRKLCETYVIEQRMLASRDWRIDVLAVVVDPDQKKAWVRHIENAVWGA